MSMPGQRRRKASMASSDASLPELPEPNRPKRTTLRTGEACFAEGLRHSLSIRPIMTWPFLGAGFRFYDQDPVVLPAAVGAGNGELGLTGVRSRRALGDEAATGRVVPAGAHLRAAE